MTTRSIRIKSNNGLSILMEGQMRRLHIDSILTAGRSISRILVVTLIMKAANSYGISACSIGTKTCFKSEIFKEAVQ